MRTTIFVALGAVLSCTASLAQGVAENVSPTTYQNLTCPQIVQEGRSVSRKGLTLSGLRPGTGGSDATDTKSAVVIVWPSSPVSGEEVAKFARADSQMDALERASVGSQCSIQFQRPPKS